MKTTQDKITLTKTYRARFSGREKGAIGIFYQINTNVQGNDEQSARLALYDRFEHIQNLELTEIL